MDLIIFDDVCVLCNGFAKFVLNRDKKDRYLFTSQTSEAFKKLNIDQKLIGQTVILVKNFETKPKVFVKSRAAIEILTSLSKIYFPLKVLILVPWFIRDFFYDLISRNRYRIWGKTSVCSIAKNSKMLK